MRSHKKVDLEVTIDDLIKNSMLFEAIRMCLKCVQEQEDLRSLV